MSFQETLHIIPIMILLTVNKERFETIWTENAN